MSVEIKVLLTTREGLARHASLTDGMMRDRKEQFVGRHGWHDFTFGEYETDKFDSVVFGTEGGPIYVIAMTEDAFGNYGHLASARIMPTMTHCMLNDAFLDLLGGQPLNDPSTWEVTRMLAAPNLRPEVSAASVTAVLYAGNELFRRLEIPHCVAVFEKAMLPVYRQLGNPPARIIGKGRDLNGAELRVGQFNCDGALSERLLERLRAAGHGDVERRVDAAFDHFPLEQIRIALRTMRAVDENLNSDDTNLSD